MQKGEGRGRKGGRERGEEVRERIVEGTQGDVVEKQSRKQ